MQEDESVPVRIAYKRGEAADLLSISVPQLDLYILGGFIKARRYGRSLRITHDELVTFTKRDQPSPKNAKQVKVNT